MGLKLRPFKYILKFVFSVSSLFYCFAEKKDAKDVHSQPFSNSYI